MCMDKTSVAACCGSKMLPNLDFRGSSGKLETLKQSAWFMIFKMTEHTCLQASQSTCIPGTWLGRGCSSMRIINTDFPLQGPSFASRPLWPKSKKKLIKSFCMGEHRTGHSCDLQRDFGGRLICSLWAHMNLFCPAGSFGLRWVRFGL